MLQWCVSSYQLMEKWRCCKIDFSFSLQNDPGGPQFLAGLVFQVFSPPCKREELYPRSNAMPISFSLFPKTFQANATSVDSSYVSHSLSPSLKQQQNYFWDTSRSDG